MIKLSSPNWYNSCPCQLLLEIRASWTTWETGIVLKLNSESVGCLCSSCLWVIRSREASHKGRWVGAQNALCRVGRLQTPSQGSLRWEELVSDSEWGLLFLSIRSAQSEQEVCCGRYVMSHGHANLFPEDPASVGSGCCEVSLWCDCSQWRSVNLTGSKIV